MSDQFIGIYENAFSPNYCERVIEYFNKMESLGFAVDRREAENAKPLEKDDLSIYGTSESAINLVNSGTLLHEFNNIFWGIYKNKYAAKYSILESAGKHNNYSFKIKKIKIGGGYHTWHAEAVSRNSCQRLLAWQLYLNNVEGGGETEFIYQGMRIKPKQGTLLIWPAGFTHTHRGNPPYSNEKYIVGGWTEF